MGCKRIAQAQGERFEIDPEKDIVKKRIELDEGRITSPEQRAFLEAAIYRFQPRLFDPQYDQACIRNIAIGLARTCCLNPRLDREILRQLVVAFVYQCTFTPEGAGTSPEGNENPFIEGSYRLIEARNR